jgi:hypothetical protein
MLMMPIRIEPVTKFTRTSGALRQHACLASRSLPDRSCVHHADLVNVFEVFLPQLLLYPNPTDPLNGEAAALMLREPEAYKSKIKGGLLACS